MQDLLTQLSSALALLTSTGVIGHYWANKRAKEKEEDDFRTEIRDRLLVLEQTAVRESEVKQIVEEVMRPSLKGIEEIKTMMASILGDVMEMKLKDAKRQGAEEALAAKANKTTE